MKQLEIIMGMPILIEIIDPLVDKSIFKSVFTYFKYVDATFSTYKPDSEVSKLNNGEIALSNLSKDFKLILKLAKQTKVETNGYFDIYRNGNCDPSGIVKGWAIFQAAKIIKKAGYKNFYIDCGGDIQVSGKRENKKWAIGIKNPFDQTKIIKVISLYNKGVATSGTYIRGNHIYNPKLNFKLKSNLVSFTVIGPNVYEADRFATAAFAMGPEGINFIEKLSDFEAYMVDNKGVATSTSGFGKYVQKIN